MNETQIPSDILGTQEVIINELPKETTDDLVTDHMGAVEDNPDHIEQIEQQDEKEHFQEFEELKQEEQKMEQES